MVSYYLDYVTSKTQMLVRLTFIRVNYCLIYGTFETLDPARSCEGPVSYYLDYGTSETKHLGGQFL